MRLALAALAFVVASPALAACVTHPTTETAQGYTSALLKRMRALGVRDVGRVEPTGNGDHYAVVGAAFSVFLQADGAKLKEIGLVLSEPAGRGETDKLLTATAFTLARLSGTPEPTVRKQIAVDSADHASGSWNETFGPAVAVFTRSGDGTVVKAGLLSCD